MNFFAISIFLCETLGNCLWPAPAGSRKQQNKGTEHFSNPDFSPWNAQLAPDPVLKFSAMAMSWFYPPRFREQRERQSVLGAMQNHIWDL